MKTLLVMLALMGLSSFSTAGEFYSLCSSQGGNKYDTMNCLDRIETDQMNKLEKLSLKFSAKVNELETHGSSAFSGLKKEYKKEIFTFELYSDAYCSLYSRMIVGPGTGGALATTECRITEIKNRIQSLQRLLTELSLQE